MKYIEIKYKMGCDSCKSTGPPYVFLIADEGDRPRQTFTWIEAMNYVEENFRTVVKDCKLCGEDYNVSFFNIFVDNKRIYEFTPQEIIERGSRLILCFDKVDFLKSSARLMERKQNFERLSNNYKGEIHIHQTIKGFESKTVWFYVHEDYSSPLELCFFGKTQEIDFKEDGTIEHCKGLEIKFSEGKKKRFKINRIIPPGIEGVSDQDSIYFQIDGQENLIFSKYRDYTFSEK